MQGECFLASLKRFRTLEAPTPTNISTKSLPDIVKKGTPASPAHAFANKVFPQPGGPVNKAPFGILAPISLYLLGFFKKSTNSVISNFTSSAPNNLIIKLQIPATSENFVFIFLSRPKTLNPFFSFN